MKWLTDLLAFWRRWEDSYEGIISITHTAPASDAPSMTVPVFSESITQPITNPMTNPEKFYNAAKSDLGLHETLNENVPIEVGCAQAWSAVARQAGVEGIPPTGFSSTNQVDAFCASNEQFELIDGPELGATVVAISTPSEHGHVGSYAMFNVQYNGDWGILSNDSNTGTIREQWSGNEFNQYYKGTLGLVIHIYRWKTPQS